MDLQQHFVRHRRITSLADVDGGVRRQLHDNFVQLDCGIEGQFQQWGEKKYDALRTLSLSQYFMKKKAVRRLE
jgi:hypothetical protein